MKSRLFVICVLVASLVGCGDDGPNVCVGVTDGVSRTANVAKIDCTYVAVPIPSDVKNMMNDSGYKGLNLNGSMLTNALRQEVIFRISELQEAKSKDPKEPQTKNQKSSETVTSNKVESVDANKSERSEVIEELKRAEAARLKAQVQLDKINLDDKERIAEMYNELDHLKQQIYNAPTQQP